MTDTTETTVGSGNRRGRRGLPAWIRRRWVRRAAVTVVAVLVVVYGAVGWYASGEIIDGIAIKPSETKYEVDVLSVTGDSITLEVPAKDDFPADNDAVVGLEWQGGYGQVGPASAVGTTEIRSLTLVSGDLPPVGTDVASFDGYAFRGDPSVLGLEFSSVTYPSELGDLSAWFVPGDGDRWLVMVHGRGASRQEFLRTLDALRDLRMPTLVVTYRNDDGAPETGDSLILAGQREWRDVEAAVDHAVAAGARDVVLVGASMGGALALGYVMEAPDAPVAGLVLDAPLADLRHVVGLRSGEAIPIGGPVGSSIVAVARAITWMRTGLDFDAVDYVDRAGELDVPVLLFQGTEDRTVPYEVGTSFAAARPDLIEFHTVSDAGHVKAWNEDPEGYRDTVVTFLERLP